MKFSKKNFSSIVRERTNNLINPDTTEVVISIICDELINHIISSGRVIIEDFGTLKSITNLKNIKLIKFNTYPNFKGKIGSHIKRRKILDKINQ